MFNNGFQRIAMLPLKPGVKPMKKSIKIPLIRGKPGHYPTKPLCPWCKKQKVMEPHSMAILTGGALAKLGKDHYEGPSKNLKGYLGFH